MLLNFPFLAVAFLILSQRALRVTASSHYLCFYVAIFAFDIAPLLLKAYESSALPNLFYLRVVLLHR